MNDYLMGILLVIGTSILLSLMFPIFHLLCFVVDGGVGDWFRRTVKPLGRK